MGAISGDKWLQMTGGRAGLCEGWCRKDKIRKPERGQKVKKNNLINNGTCKQLKRMIRSKTGTANSSCSPVNYLCLMTSLRVYNSPCIFLTHHCLFFTVSLSATLSALSFAFLGYFSVQARRSPVGGVFRSQSPSAHAIYFI